MAVSSVLIVAPGVGGTMPTYVLRPAVTFRWTGGTGPWDTEVIWDTDPSFANGNGDRQIETQTGLVTIAEQTLTPSADLADTTPGTTWYLKATVTDTNDSGSASDSDNNFTYSDPRAQNRYRYLLANVHPGWDEPTHPTEYARAQNRYRYLLGNIHPGYDEPTHPTEYAPDQNRYRYLIGNVYAPGSRYSHGYDWTESVAIKGAAPWEVDETRDIDRTLYLLANVDATQPCPFITGLSTTTVRVGDAIVITGQGLTGDQWLTPVAVSSNPTGTGQARLYDGYILQDGSSSSLYGWWDSGANQTTGHYLQLDLGSVRPITRLRQVTVSSSYYPRSWEVYGSTTGAFGGEQVLLGSGSHSTATAYGDSLYTDLTPGSYRYVRIVLTSGTNWSWRLSEVEVLLQTEAWQPEVRLYDTPDLGGSYTVLSIVSTTAGDTEDSIVATIPGGATSGFVAVVHTVGATCAGSNFRGLTVIAAEPDREAGWWIELWDLRNTTRVVSPLTPIYSAGYEEIADDVGRGWIEVPADLPDLREILDQSATPPVQRLVKVYLHDRYAYSFLPAGMKRTYSDDGAVAVRVYGPGAEEILRWAHAHNYDYPAYPSQTSTWLYGSLDNVWTGGDMEPENRLQNPGFEDLDELPWSTVPTGGIFASEFFARTGVAGVKITPTALGGGIQQTVSVTNGQRIYFDAWVRDPTGTGPRTVRLQAVKSDESTVAVSTDLVLTATWQRMTITTIADETGTWSWQLIQTAGPLVDLGASEGLAMDDATAYVDLPIQLNGVYRATALLSRTNAVDGEHSMELQIDAGSDALYNGIDGVIPVQPNQRYTLRVTITGTAGDRVFFQGRFNNFLSRDEKDLTGGADLFTITGTTGDDETTIRWGIAGREAAAFTVYVDAFQAVAGADAAASGQIVLDVLNRVQTRGLLTFVQPAFTAGLDSAGVPWPETIPIEVQPSWSLWDVCEYMIGLGYSAKLAPNNWLAGGDSGWSLYLWGPGTVGTDYSALPDGPAILPGSAVAVASRSETAPIATKVSGSGEAGVWTTVDADAATIASLELREEWIRNEAAPDALTLFRALTQRLNVGLGRGAQATVKLTEAGDPLPYLDFRVYDRIRVNLPADGLQQPWIPDDTYAVAAATVELYADGAQRYTLDLGSYELHADRLRDLILDRLLRRQTAENYQPGTGSVSTALRIV